jgi:hypothetical protein
VRDFDPLNQLNLPTKEEDLIDACSPTTKVRGLRVTDTMQARKMNATSFMIVTTTMITTRKNGTSDSKVNDVGMNDRHLPASPRRMLGDSRWRNHATTRSPMLVEVTGPNRAAVDQTGADRKP